MVYVYCMSVMNEKKVILKSTVQLNYVLLNLHIHELQNAELKFILSQP